MSRGLGAGQLLKGAWSAALNATEKRVSRARPAPPFQASRFPSSSPFPLYSPHHIHFFLFWSLVFFNLSLAVFFSTHAPWCVKGARSTVKSGEATHRPQLWAVTGQAAAGMVRGRRDESGLGFSASTCSLRPTGNAIQAFGNGTDVNLSPKNPSFQATQAPRAEKTPALPDDLSDSTSLGTSVITTCTSVQVRRCGSVAGEWSQGELRPLTSTVMSEVGAGNERTGGQA